MQQNGSLADGLTSLVSSSSPAFWFRTHTRSFSFASSPGAIAIEIFNLEL